MSTALTVLRQRLLRELDLGWVIENADVDSFAAGSITAANMLRNSNTSAGYYKGQKVVIFRPGAASAADYIRYAGLLTRDTGLLAHTGANYADTTKGSEVVELWKYGIRPTRELIASLNRVLEFEFQTTHLALSHISPTDGDMQLSTDTNWTDVGTPTTSAKATTAAYTPWGQRNYHLVGDATNEGTQSGNIFIRQGGQFSAFTIISADTGTASFQGRDATNSADIGTAVTHSERKPQLMAIQNQSVPATCKSLALRALGTTNPSDFYINQMWLYNLEDLTCSLPSLVAESFMAPRILQAVPRYQTAANVYDAGGFDFKPLNEGEDYWFVTNHSDARPYKVRFANTSYYQWPLFVEASIPSSAYTTFAEDETATTNVALHNLLPRWKMDVLTTILLGKIPEDRWKLYYETARNELISAKIARPQKSVSRPVNWYSGVTPL